VVSADADRAAEQAVARYQHVLDSLRTAYDGRGGNGHEGPTGNDQHEPPRFFSLRTDEQIKGFTTRYFSLFDFHVIEPGKHHFQSLTMRRPG
jgi:hypothetical protein